MNAPRFSSFGLALLISAVTLSGLAEPLSTAFTYQGRLAQGGAPANGPFDLAFSLYDAPVAGNLVAPTLTNSAVSVSNGLFTAQLDFGASAFTGEGRWLEIAVRQGTDDFTVLNPRQPLTAAPYAVQALNAVSAGAVAATNLTGNLADAQLSTNVALLSSSPQFSGGITASNFTGNGSGLTSLDASALTTGTLDDARLSANVLRFGAGTNLLAALIASVPANTPPLVLTPQTNDPAHPVTSSHGVVNALKWAEGADPEVPVAHVVVWRNWGGEWANGGAAVGDETMNIGCLNIRLENGWYTSLGKPGYISIGNEDAGGPVRINYDMNSVLAKTNAIGVSLPLELDAFSSDANGGSRDQGLPMCTPGLQAHAVPAGQLQAIVDPYDGGKYAQGELWFYRSVPFLQSYGNYSSGVLGGKMLTDGWEFYGKLVQEKRSQVAGATLALDFGAAQCTGISLTGDTTLSITNSRDSGTAYEQRIFLLRAGPQNINLTWPEGMTWFTPMPASITAGHLLRLQIESVGAGLGNKLVHAEDAVDNGFWDPDLEPYFTAATVTNIPLQLSLNIFVKALKSAGVWDDLANGALYVYGTGTAAGDAVNLRNPGAFTMTWQGNLASDASHTPGGAQGDGTTGYGDTHYNPSLNGALKTLYHYGSPDYNSDYIDSLSANDGTNTTYLQIKERPYLRFGLAVPADSQFVSSPYPFTNTPTIWFAAVQMNDSQLVAPRSDIFAAPPTYTATPGAPLNLDLFAFARNYAGSPPDHFWDGTIFVHALSPNPMSDDHVQALSTAIQNLRASLGLP